MGKPLTTKDTKDQSTRGEAKAFLPVASCPLWLAVFVWVLALAIGTACAQGDPIIDGLKGKLSSSNVGDKPKVCLQIAEHQMTETSKLYAASEDEKAQPTLTDVVAYSELARDYAIQSHKHQKQTEIAVRGMARKLTEILHTLGHEEQAPVKEALNRLQRVRDDLLASMFSKGDK